MRLFYLIFISITFIIFNNCTRVSDYTKSNKKQFDRIELAKIDNSMQFYIDSQKIAGISVMLVKDAEIAYSNHYGNSNISEKSILNEESIFRIYSMTKPIVSVAFMKLYEQNKFELDDPVSKYIKEFKDLKVFTEENGKHVLVPQQKEMTIRNLFTHTSGLTYGWKPNSYVDSLYRKSEILSWDETLQTKVEKLSKIPLKYQPENQWEYGVSIDVIGYLIEVISGMPLDVYLKKIMFIPLNMTDTDFFVPDEKKPRLTTVYGSTDNKLIELDDINKKLFLTKPKLLSGGGGLVSTITDYSKFCQMILNGGILHGERILKEETITLIKTNQMPDKKEAWEGVGFGLGFKVILDTTNIPNHTNGEISWGGAADTHFWIDFENNLYGLAFAQKMPHDQVKFDIEFKKLVYKALY